MLSPSYPSPRASFEVETSWTYRGHEYVSKILTILFYQPLFLLSIFSLSLLSNILIHTKSLYYRGLVFAVAASDAHGLCFSGGMDTVVREFDFFKNKLFFWVLYCSCLPQSIFPSLDSIFFTPSHPCLPYPYPPPFTKPSSLGSWRLVPPDVDKFSAYTSYAGEVLSGHTDVIWSLSAHPTAPLLVSASADGSCRCV